MGFPGPSVDGAALQAGPSLSLQGHLLSQGLLTVLQPPWTGTLRPTCNSEAKEGNGSVLTKRKELLRYNMLFLSGAHSTVEQSRALRGHRDMGLNPGSAIYYCMALS